MICKELGAKKLKPNKMTIQNNTIQLTFAQQIAKGILQSFIDRYNKHLKEKKHPNQMIYLLVENKPITLYLN